MIRSVVFLVLPESPTLRQSALCRQTMRPLTRCQTSPFESPLCMPVHQLCVRLYSPEMSTKNAKDGWVILYDNRRSISNGRLQSFVTVELHTLADLT